MVGKWVVGIVSLIVTYFVLSAVVMIGFSETEMERYSGLIGLVVGIIVLIIIVNRDDYDDTERMQKEIEKRKKQIEQHEKAIKYYEKRIDELENTSL